MDSWGSGYEEVAGSFEYRSEFSGTIMEEEFLEYSTNYYIKNRKVSDRFTIEC